MDEPIEVDQEADDEEDDAYEYDFSFLYSTPKKENIVDFVAYKPSSKLVNLK